MQYFQVKVQFRTEDENGKVKKQNVAYLVDAQSVTDCASTRYNTFCFFTLPLSSSTLN